METTIQDVKPPDAEAPEACDQQSAAGTPSDKTPQEFFAEVTNRADVREILEELAKA